MLRSHSGGRMFGNCKAQGRLLRRQTCSARVARGSWATARQSSNEATSHNSTTAALRTAEARESALRAARLRRQSQQRDREAAEERKREEKRAYQTRYNRAARKWVSTIIALPILLVTSYYLFDRLALGNKPKEMPKYKSNMETS